MKWEIFTDNGRDYVIIPTPVETRYLIPEAPSSFDKLEAVMMDMDGSTTDTEKLVLEAMRQMMAKTLGNPQFRFARDDFPNIVGDSTTNHVKYLANRYNLDAAQLNCYIDNYYEKYHRILYDVRDGRVMDVLIEPMLGLGSFLAALKEKGIKVGMVTSSLKKEADIVMTEIFKQLDIDTDYESYYDGVIAADEVGETFLKPHPNLYIRMAEEKLGLKDKKRAFVIEDSTAGILAARIAGFAVAAVSHHHTQDHNFDLANLGLMKGGLPEILEKNLFQF